MNKTLNIISNLVSLVTQLKDENSMLVNEIIKTKLNSNLTLNRPPPPPPSVEMEGYKKSKQYKQFKIYNNRFRNIV